MKRLTAFSSKIWRGFWRGYADYVRHLALTSFAFNVGLGNLQNSTLRMKHNRGEYAVAADEFLKWNKSAGKVLNGLVVRRNDERNLYLGGTHG
jgi:GH24 family phage-related lysozyme (muramidase)